MEEVVITKKCSYCHVYKSVSDFYPDKRGKHRVQSVCKICNAIRTRVWRDKNKEKYVEAYRAEYSRNSEKHRAKKLASRYNITSEQYDILLWHQGGVCAICKRPPTDTRRLSVDHNHSTGAVRGLLCDGCNRNLVAAIESEHFDAAMAYVEKWGK